MSIPKTAGRRPCERRARATADAKEKPRCLTTSCQSRCRTMPPPPSRRTRRPCGVATLVSSRSRRRCAPRTSSSSSAVDSGGPERTRQVGPSTKRLHATDGPYAGTKEVLGGFYILRTALDLDAATDWAAKVSDAIDGPIEVRPCSSTRRPVIRPGVGRSATARGYDFVLCCRSRWRTIESTTETGPRSARDRRETRPDRSP